MVQRKALSPRVRFEVFKRDKFACQYCGSAAPVVVLQVDHIKPVAEGGLNDILNLITSCTTCNGGKGAVPLSDTSTIDKQRAQLEELEDRRQQIDMMLQWRDELQNVTKDLISGIVTRIQERTGFAPSEAGQTDLRRWIKQHGAQEVLRAVDEAFDTYAEYEDDRVTPESWDRAFSKVPGVIRILKQEAEKPYMRRLFYIQGIVRNRIRSPRFDCFDYLEHVFKAGEELDDLEKQAKKIRSFEDLKHYYEAWLTGSGRPW